MVTPICEEPLCRIICIFLFFFFPPLLRHRLHFASPPPLITAPQMKGVLFDSVLIIQLQSNNSTLQEERRERGKKKCGPSDNFFKPSPPYNPKWFWMGRKSE